MIALDKKNNNILPLVFKVNRKIINKGFWCILMCFIIMSLIMAILVQDSFCILFTILFFGTTSYLIVVYYITILVSNIWLVVLSQEGITKSFWLLHNDLSWEEISYFVKRPTVLSQSQLTIYTYSEKRRMIIPDCFDCVSIAKILDEKGIPKKIERSILKDMITRHFGK